MAFSGKATVYNGAQMKTQDASNNSHLCVKELSHQMWPFTIMDHKTKRTPRNTHVSDSMLLRFCVCFPCQCLVKELLHSALIKKKKKNTRGFTRKKLRSTIVATAGRRLVSDTVASTFPLDECFGCTCRGLSGIPDMHTCTGARGESNIPAIIQHAEQQRRHHAIRPRSRGASEDRMERRERERGRGRKPEDEGTPVN